MSQNNEALHAALNDMRSVGTNPRFLLLGKIFKSSENLFKGSETTLEKFRQKISFSNKKFGLQ